MKRYDIATKFKPQEILEKIVKQVDREFNEVDKGLRLFFLMKFGIPYGCVEGTMEFYSEGNKTYFCYNNTAFAVKEFSHGYSISSTMSEDEQSKWLLNMPMKEFKIFGMTFKK